MVAFCYKGGAGHQIVRFMLFFFIEAPFGFLLEPLGTRMSGAFGILRMPKAEVLGLGQVFGKLVQ